MDLDDRLEIKLIEARALPEVPGGLANPYALISVGETTEQTDLRSRTLAPKWGDDALTMVFSEIVAFGLEWIVVTMLHKDMSGNGDAVLGVAKIPLTTALCGPSVPTSDWRVVRRRAPLDHAPGRTIEKEQRRAAAAPSLSSSRRTHRTSRERASAGGRVRAVPRATDPFGRVPIGRCTRAGPPDPLPIQSQGRSSKTTPRGVVVRARARDESGDDGAPRAGVVHSTDDDGDDRHGGGGDARRTAATTAVSQVSALRSAQHDVEDAGGRGREGRDHLLCRRRWHHSEPG